MSHFSVANKLDVLISPFMLCSVTANGIFRAHSTMKILWLTEHGINVEISKLTTKCHGIPFSVANQLNVLISLFMLCSVNHRISWLTAHDIYRAHSTMKILWLTEHSINVEISK